MITRTVGDLQVSAVALGGCPFGFGPSERDADSIATLHAAIDAGITLIDTALAYTNLEEASHGERIVGQAIRSHAAGEGVVVATKGGHYRESETSWQVDGRPASIRRDCEISLRTLGVDCLDLYQLHWPDPEVPFEDSVGALEELRSRGWVRRVGLSNVTIEQIEVARTITAVSAVQNHFSPGTTSDRPTVDHCAQHGIAYLAYSPLGGGREAGRLGQTRPGFASVAEAHSVTPQQVALAWHLATSPALIPISGAGRIASVRDSAAAADLVLGADEMALLSRDVAPA